MSDPQAGLQFNAWTSAWLPLKGDGGTTWASPVEVLSGEKDAADLDYPRDDFRVFARLLLSALVQALMPAKDKAEFLERLANPMPRNQLERLLQPHLADFELFGEEPFLQVKPLAEPPKKGAASFVFPSEDLFPSAERIDRLSPAIALATLFIEQAFAGGAGRGYGAGPGGQPGAMTLIDPGSVRVGAWANTVTLDRAAQLWAKDGPRPWSNEVRTGKSRAATGLVEGLFFQPRSIWLIPAGEGRCSFSGVEGPLVIRSPYGPKSSLAQKPGGAEDLWQHPCAPMAVNSSGIAAVRLSPDRPAWTGLAQLLRPVSRAKTKVSHPREGPAPVLQQWKTLTGLPLRPRLLVLDYDRDKANIRGRFFESYPLVQHLLDDDVIEQLRAVLDDAQEIRNALMRELTSAHDGRKQGGLARGDAEATFWRRTESPFLAWLGVMTEASGWSAEVEARVAVATRTMQATLRRAAFDIFDAHVSLSEFDPRKQSLVAAARRRLRRTLYPPAPRAQAVPPHTEVMQ